MFNSMKYSLNMKTSVLNRAIRDGKLSIRCLWGLNTGAWHAARAQGRQTQHLFAFLDFFIVFLSQGELTGQCPVEIWLSGNWKLEAKSNDISHAPATAARQGESNWLCLCICAFVYLYLCICICVFVYLYMCIWKPSQMMSVTHQQLQQDRGRATDIDTQLSCHLHFASPDEIFASPDEIFASPECNICIPRWSICIPRWNFCIPRWNTWDSIWKQQELIFDSLMSIFHIRDIMRCPSSWQKKLDLSPRWKTGDRFNAGKEGGRGEKSCWLDGKHFNCWVNLGFRKLVLGNLGFSVHTLLSDWKYDEHI